MQVNNKNLLFEVEIPGRVGIKKNNRQIFKNNYGQTKSLPSKGYKSWADMAVFYIYKASRKHRPNLPINTQIFAYFEFHFKDKRALPDTSNCLEGVQDLMQTVGIFPNDQQIQSILAHRKITGENKTIVKLFESKTQGE